MLCSKCKIFSIHLTNYDSCICECGHVICRSCSEQTPHRNKCSICNGKTVRLTEFYMEGLPKIIFRTCNENEEFVENSKLMEDENDLLSLYGSNEVCMNSTKLRKNEYPSDKQPLQTNKQQVNQSNSFIQKPLQLQTISDAFIETKYKFLAVLNTDTDEKLADCSTVLQHLSEFRKATNYTPQSKLSVYKMQDVESVFKSTIVTTSKTCLATNTNSALYKRNSTKSIAAQTTVESKVDASTVMEIENPKKESNLLFQNELSANLCDKLRREVYAPFNGEKLKTKNRFVVKGEVTDISPKIIAFDVTTKEKQNYLEETMNIPNLLFHGRNHRDEILRQSQLFLRQKIFEEIYSPFDKRPILTSPASELITSSKEDTTSSITDPIAKQNKANEVVENPNPTQSGAFRPEIERVSALSTKLYPKPGVDTSLVTNSNDLASNSFTEDGYIQEPSVFDPNKSFVKNFTTSTVGEHQCSPLTSQNSNVKTCLPFSSYRSLNKEQSIKPIGVLPKSNHAFPSRKKVDSSVLITNELNFNVPKIESEQEVINEMIKPSGNTVYFCQTATDQKIRLETIPNSSIQLDRKHANLVGDYLQSSEDLEKCSQEKDLLCFIQKQYPNLRLKNLKKIIMGLPTNEHDYENDPELKKNLQVTPPQGKHELPLEKNEHPTQTNTTEINPSVCQSSKSHTCNDLLRQINMIASRAFFSRPCTARVPRPQFKLLLPINNNAPSEKMPKEILRACNLNMPRTPIVCPVTACSKLVFITEFSRHMKVDHGRIPVECISPGEHKNVFLESRLGAFGVNKCHVLFMVTDKIKDFGSIQFKDYLPIVLMSTRIRLTDMINADTKTQVQPLRYDNCLMIWLTGVIFPNLPVYYTLVAWRRKSNLPRCYIAHSGKIYSMRGSQNFQSLFKSR